MASEIGKIVHCKICGTPIVAKGSRLFCPVCYNQNRRNAAQRSNARTKVQREQMKREEEKMKQNNCAVTSAAGLNMRAKLADMGGMSYGELSMWEKTHGLEFAAWEHEWEKLNSGTASDGLKFPDHLPEGFPTRKAPPAHQSASRRIWKILYVPVLRTHYAAQDDASRPYRVYSPRKQASCVSYPCSKREHQQYT